MHIIYDLDKKLACFLKDGVLLSWSYLLENTCNYGDVINGTISMDHFWSNKKMNKFFIVHTKEFSCLKKQEGQ